MTHTLTPDRRAKLRRLRGDYAYWAPTLYRIRDKRARLIPFRLKPNQVEVGLAESRAMESQGRFRGYILKGRQGGFTTDQQARNLHAVWGKSGVSALTLADTLQNTDKIFEITRRAIDNFPPDFLPSMGERMTREVHFTKRDSSFWTATAGAKRSGQSVTLLRAHLSEFAHYDEPRARLKTIIPALVPQGSSLLLETTASGYGSEAHEFWIETMEGKNGFTPLFFPWWECDPEFYRLPLLAPDELGRLEPDEQDLVDHKGLDLEQIKWRRHQMLDMGVPEFMQEYAEDSDTCWMAPGGLLFKVTQLKKLRHLAEEVKPIEELLGGTLMIYGEPEAGERVILGADTAEGVGQDRSTFIARAFPSWRLIAKFACPEIEPDPFGDLIADWGMKWGGAFLVVEKNAHGITVIRRVRDVHNYPVDRIYHRVSQDTADQEKGSKIGWATTGESKPLMVDAARQFFNAVEQGLVPPPSLAAVQDAFGVRRNANGRVELTGKDVLVSEMLAWIGRSQPPHTWEAW